MTAEKQAAVAAIEKKADLVAQVADEIWSFAELSLQEEQSADLYCRVLEQEGFKVERGICNIPTAFSAFYGSGRPIIGLLAEYDALSGLSQKGGSLTREELVSGGCGHGCGHNLLGAGAMAAALGVKAYLEAAKIPGTVVLYGCPGEEGGAAKAFMARSGCGPHLAPGRRQRGAYRLLQLLHPNPVPLHRRGGPCRRRPGPWPQRPGRGGADERGRPVPAGAHE